MAGLSSGRPVTLRAATRDGSGKEWSSEAVFAPDGEGAVDLSRADFSRPVPLVEFYRDNLKDQGVVEAAAIPVERIEGPVLLISGGNDQVWPAESLSDLAMAGIERRRRPYPRVHLKCPKAGHLTSYPYLPITGEGIRLAEMGLTLAFGGEPAAAAVAADSWPRVREFFREALG